jgi:2-succinyl-5-enolpyruvyl-6-hydroxy-3-cyclohexene-1-carboxylate synthase
MKNIVSALLAVLVGSPSVGATNKPESKMIQTPEGSITATTTTVEPVPQTIVMASPKQVAEINALASKARGFVSKYLPDVLSPSLQDFDEAFRLWQQEKMSTYTEQQVIEVLGAQLGSKLISDLDMEWVVVSDQYGTDFAVRAKKHEVMAFPFSSVAKRIERKQYEFMVGVYRTVQHTIATGDVKTR